MVSKKSILNNELLKEVIFIRVNTLWKMLALDEQGKLPEVEEEGATGKYDNKGGQSLFQAVLSSRMSMKSISIIPLLMSMNPKC